MTNWAKYATVTIAVVAVALLLYAILILPQPSSTSDHMGMWGSHTVSTGGLAIVVVATMLLVVAVMFMFMRETYEPLPPTMIPIPPQVTPQQPKPDATPHPEDGHDVVETLRTEGVAREEYLVLRLLTGDERTMFKAIMDSGGDALQKDLIVRTKMSNSKVSRLLDRLELKGVVSKERHGSTNRVKIKLGSTP
jgi:uncharacterized membrane protein